MFGFFSFIWESILKGHSWRCFYMSARKKIRWGCDRDAEEMLGGDDDEGADDKRC